MGGPAAADRVSATLPGMHNERTPTWSTAPRIAFIVVGATAIASEFDRAPDRWARGLRRGLGIEPVPVAARPAEPAGV